MNSFETKIRKKTITDFDEQWKLHGGELNEDYWSSDEVLIDQFSSLFDVNEIKGKVIADVGAGTGRIVKTLLKYNPKRLFAIEPSSNGINHIKKNLQKHSNITVLQSDGLSFKTNELCDIITSLGVIHHIKNPTDVLKNIRSNLKPKGKIIIWVYGYENNISYIFLYNILSVITKVLPNKLLYGFSSLLNFLIVPYIFLCKFIKLPLRDYFLKVFSKFGWKKRKDTIFDQLNPAYAKYYKRHELEKELIDAGFVNLKFHHRHNYSWTAVAENI